MNRIISKIFSSGPFSAVRPYLGDSDRSVEPEEEAVESPREEFERSEGEPARSAAPPAQELGDQATRGGMKAAIGAFPQVVHLLVDPSQDWGENLSMEVGLPLISLEDKTVDGLEAELRKPEYADGFILEGYPDDQDSVEKLDGLLQNTGPEGRRVLSWSLNDGANQEVIDHYMNQDLLWMVPESSDPACPVQAKDNLMSCLTGLPALQ